MLDVLKTDLAIEDKDEEKAVEVGPEKLDIMVSDSVGNKALSMLRGTCDNHKEMEKSDVSWLQILPTAMRARRSRAAQTHHLASAASKFNGDDLLAA